MEFLEEVSHLLDYHRWPLSDTSGAAIIVVASIYVIHAVHWRVSGYKRQCTTKLHLRVLQEPEKDGRSDHNIFCREQTELYDVLFPLLDYCVMKHTAKEIPILSEQERHHAKMHHASNKERKAANTVPLRWQWLVSLGRFLMRDCPPQVQLGCVGHIEATSTLWVPMMLNMPFTAGYLPNGMIYHCIEEVEHAALTTQWIRNQMYTLTPLLTFPIAVLLYFALFLLPPVVKLMVEPTLLVYQPVRVCQDLVLYYCTFVPIFLVSTLSCIIYWVLPFIPQTDESQALNLQVWEEETQRRGLKITIPMTATYTIRGAEIRIAE